MKFNGELKFPEVDHPGVPVVFSIDGQQAEMFVEGESLGRWSLYDIHARRLVASAFQIDLEGTEVTFVADDPIDFAYRGVEHMAKTWADIKSKRIARRVIAVRKSRKGVAESRVDDLRFAMEQNLESVGPRRLAGEPDESPASPIDRIMTTPATTHAAAEVLSEDEQAEPIQSSISEEHESSAEDDWDRRDAAGAIPIVGEEAFQAETESDVSLETADTVSADEIPTTDTESIDQVETSPISPTPEELEIEAARRQLAEDRVRLEEERRAAEEREANLVEAYRLEMQRLEAEREQLRVEAETQEAEVSDPEPADGGVPDAQPVHDHEPEPEPETGPEPEPVREPDQVSSPGRSVVDLSDIEVPDSEPPPPPVRTERVPEPVFEPEPEPALAGAGKDRRAGLMGAVKAAFGTGVKDHAHSFIEAPGGLGITRYVCEECGYVSISSGR